MDLDDLTKIAFSIIKDDDPYKESKQLQMRNWGRGYLETINTGNISFFLDILSDKECWEKTDTIHGIKLNRRLVAKKVIEPQSWKGTSNLLKDFYLYQIACWCCLEEEIISLFEHFKQEDKIKEGDSDALKKLVKSVSGNWCTDAMMQFWSHFISGYISELDLKGQHPYVFGLHRAAISSRRRRVEAVEFFWDKVQSLPESELSSQEKDEVFMRIAVHAAGDSGYPDVFEFCLSQINPDKYSELLKRDLEKNGYYGSLGRMKDMLSFDKFQELFDCLKSSEVSEDDYSLWLKFMIKDCPEDYLGSGVEVFMHMWKKEGFDNHRTFTLDEEMMEDSSFQGKFSVHLVEKGFMKPVWAMLDKANSRQIKEFMDSKKDHISSILLGKGDSNSLNKFLGYGKFVDKGIDQEIRPGPSGELTEVEVRRTHSQSR
ncbi:hypothetical protein HGO53_06650 [Wolbachia endosymbiont of Diaphorina citri]|uniref:hypothetical protein n=1 Tax=Wolbachia endosymbiont of Diaphorina citri TaxID=116598 RepID=UPI00155E6C0F|nr:hypothetical protein [Wolbachia endosymbiont of Diaphorina citri]QJT94994.1 hypothetical protein HGO48_06795 [Wolbachia endosymbiont of Diaphorina citri]QJT96095.1 hypothetical protein HGO49_05940 [Wolbachia endosymbiont of Diaphorina citri]QJT97456.1 hypothetical protein HGO53_06650 [Wolbachia endosymbiont of Diaphorina citri]QLK11942.1 hypothetical protein FK497_07250 [Wolbachia endosymbiont of Diaphorina citri]QXY86713.1 hypothetical protein GZ064_01575 [Wolbachia endosymbiont of Diaphor